MDDRVGFAIIVIFAVASVTAFGGYAAGIIHGDGYTYSEMTVTADDGVAEVTGEGHYRDGDSVTLTATTKTGYVFQGWYDREENLVSQANPYTFVSEDDVKLTAATIKGMESSAYHTDGIARVYGTDLRGMEITLNAMVEDGYEFVKWIQIKTGAEYTGSSSLEKVDLREQNLYVAVSDSTAYQGDLTLTVTKNDVDVSTMVWVVTDAETGDYVASQTGTSTLSVKVAAGSYDVHVSWKNGTETMHDDFKKVVK